MSLINAEEDADHSSICDEEKISEERSHSPVPSVLSLKSDKSMNMPVHLKVGGSLFDQSSDERSDSVQEILHSPVHSVLSMKTDSEMQIPENSQPHQRHDPQTHQLNIHKRMKSYIKMRHQYVFEGLVKQRNSTLLNKIYTELYITESESGEISNEHEVRQIETQSRRTTTEDTPIKCNEIFKPLPGQDKPIRTVLTKGVAGIGKTISVQKFVLDWAEGKANQDVHLIFPLPFRELNSLKDKKLSLSDLLHVFFPETMEMDISSDKYKVCLIFDGLDECRLSLDFQSNVRLCDVCESSSMDVLLTNLMKGNLLPSALIWITSRPAAANLIPSESVDRVTEVRGFNEPQKEEYFRKRISDQSLANRIITHLKSSRSLYIMCHIPVFCWISATVLERMLSEAESREIPKTLTQMYTHFLIIQTNIKHKKDYEKKVEDEDMIRKLGKMAFQQLVRGNVTFYEEDLRECGIDVTEASVYSGLCTQIFREKSGLYQGKVYCFVHLSIQEHLAALYVHLSFHNSNKNVLDQGEDHESEIPVTLSNLHKCAIDKASHNKNGHLDLFLRFLMGLSLESNQTILEGLLVKRTDSSLERAKTTKYLEEKIQNSYCPNDCLLLFHCLNELNEHSVTNEIQSYLNSGKLNKKGMSRTLWSALVYILTTSNEKFDEFELHNYGRSDETVRWMHPVIKLSTKARLHDCNITVMGCAMLSSILSSSSNVRELDLSHNNLEDSGVEMLCAGVKRSCHKEWVMKEWNIIFQKKMLSQSCKSGDQHMQENHEKDEFHLKHDTAGLQDTECNLECLKIKSCGVTEAGCVFLSSALNSNPLHLRELDLSWNNLGDSGVQHLSTVMEKAHCALEILKLEKCGMTEKSCAALASALGSKTSSLTELDLSINDLRDSGVKLLCTGLKNPHCKLEKLGLSKCSVTKEGVSDLAEALKLNPSHLTELNLLENHLEESDIKLLSVIQEESLYNQRKQQ
ncbi:NACHT, LRR and PYD domains-containing protein 3-like [Myxocyprinus asiaticus]|uniref:NACHT, LRR and PYD domains-containing protein 3-like n=1 Tax=Myxocyprinus asiaticus TaxID=70543 RepID=UPI00222236CD|nr:NACHT, LRR and PYD domains-containing protein 3-like [Myxocyprinus asiaticus]